MARCDGGSTVENPPFEVAPDFVHYPYKDHRETVIQETQKGEGGLVPCTFPVPDTHGLLQGPRIPFLNGENVGQSKNLDFVPPMNSVSNQNHRKDPGFWRTVTVKS
jgi:hypothetical protein